ncbi:SulP family inorganic anion transporter [Haliangium sp.]|uniref:SulP family inorganic anion transporter n=1 Tax=Haliangium sp. TaxID=2663208 RepID=UPI003D0EB2DB
MAGLRELFPFLDLRGVRRSDVARDLTSAAAVAVLAIPQGVAYAMIAGLPPAMGLYAVCAPALVGSLFRSSRHVITGPTNALSLLVGAAVAARAGFSPTETALLLALLVGLLQVAAGLLRLGVLVDYISTPVVLGYITGAGVLIGVGQLPNLSATAGGGEHLPGQILAWVEGLGAASPLSLGIGLGAAVLLLLLRRIDRRIPGAIVMLAVVTGLSWGLDLGAHGVPRIMDLAPIPLGLPPLTAPSLAGWTELLPAAVAAAVLSLVESSAVARSTSARTGQRLELSTEFVGQGLANLAAAFTGAYPTSGSLSRSAVNEQTGARTRLSGAASGLAMLAVVAVLGPVVNYAPVSALAGLLLVVAADLVDLARIRSILASRRSDAVAFIVTMLGTWAMPLDEAIYVGVAISLVLFLHRARLLPSSRIVVGRDGELATAELDDPLRAGECPSIRVVHVEGHLFFGAAGELRAVLDELVADAAVKVVILRLKWAQNLDYTAAVVLQTVQARLAAQGRTMLLVGMRSDALEVLERTGVADAFGEHQLFPARSRWFEALSQAIAAALELVEPHACGPACPLARYLERARELGRDC